MAVGITALISSILGMIGGIAPKVVDIVKDGRDHAREVEMLALQHKYQMERLAANASAKVEEAEAAVSAREVDAMIAAINAVPASVGIAWVDAFNAILRPASAALMIVLFGVMALGVGGVIPAQDFTPLYTLATEGVIGYLFGYRSTAAIKRG